ncbi:MAG: hypothetical protein M1526_06480 [Candidatus Thermoplasmatota archaeon]|jgi:hypothetical protein|nr:hypothetical protein [Candidatus Thermoplasmatota archaeon]
MAPSNDNSHSELEIKWEDVLLLDKYGIWKWDSVIIVAGIFIISYGWALLAGSILEQILGFALIIFGIFIIGFSSERVYSRYLKLRRLK